MREITLQEVLDAREARVSRQKRLLAAYGRPLLSFTMNMAGPVKRSALADFAFREGLAALRGRLGTALLHEEITDAPAGLEAVLAWLENGRLREIGPATEVCAHYENQ